MKVWLLRQPTRSPPISITWTVPSPNSSAPGIEAIVVVISCTLSVGSHRLLGRLPSRICHQGEAAPAAAGIADAAAEVASRTARTTERRLDILEISLRRREGDF